MSFITFTSCNTKADAKADAKAEAEVFESTLDKTEYGKALLQKLKSNQIKKKFAIGRIIVISHY